MRYTNDYMHSKDIDWFCSVNKKYWIHIASAGGILPDKINDRNQLRNIQHRVFNFPDIYADEEIIKNENFLQARFNDDEIAIETYLSSFKSMAKKGFISLDRTNLSDLEDPAYHVVCRPRNIEPLVQFEEIINFQSEDDLVFSKMSNNINLLDILK
jgi:hypothetical protein